MSKKSRTKPAGAPAKPASPSSNSPSSNRSAILAQRQAHQAAQRRNQMILTGVGIGIIALIVLGIIFGPQLFGGASATATPTGAAAQSTSIPVGEVVTTASGLQIEELVLGTGPAAATGDTVSVHYVGTLTDGTQFDSSIDRGQPYDVTIGVSSVIDGWTEGLVGMQVGGKRRLTIPPELGYGATGYPPIIPGDATLIFEIELLALE